jgi:divalent metal cation (Fe/Co/Zn/Cd) transporter
MNEAAVMRARNVRRGLALEYLSVGYNSLEGIIAVASGLIAGSIALVGFGFDSAIEVLSGVTLLWRLHSDADEGRRERIEAISLKIVGMLFLLLAAWVLYDASRSLLLGDAPEESLPGIILAALSVMIMPLIVRAKRRVATAISSHALRADAKQTELCTWLSAILLAGLLLNALFGLWWADPVAALLMVPIIGREGVQALRGEQCRDGCH